MENRSLRGEMIGEKRGRHDEHIDFKRKIWYGARGGGSRAAKPDAGAVSGRARNGLRHCGTSNAAGQRHALPIVWRVGAPCKIAV